MSATQSQDHLPKEERLVMPHGHDCARDRIEAHVREIQVICDEFGYDPCEWLNDETAQGDRPPFFHCKICGRTVNFPKGAQPSVVIGTGNKTALRKRVEP